MNDADERLRARERMVEHQLRRRDVKDERVLSAMAEVPREAFVPEAARAHAYDDCALAIGSGQTISQPYMVARVAELARVAPNDQVLEVGLGSGYQAAVLAKLARHVVGIERVAELTERARATLAQLGVDNVEAHEGDGTLGYAAAAPYDAIVVSAGAPHVPDALVAQLAPHGRLVIPVGDSERQVLMLIERTETGLRTSDHEACRYVPLLGASGWHET
jgi:protein-L-isoaspartate(D-aspartate) O-methyltransferase